MSDSELAEALGQIEDLLAVAVNRGLLEKLKKGVTLAERVSAPWKIMPSGRKFDDITRRGRVWVDFLEKWTGLP